MALKRTIDTQDYESYEIAWLLGCNEVECTKRMCHSTNQKCVYGEEISYQMRCMLILKVKRSMPDVIRYIIIDLLTDLYRTEAPRLPVLIKNDIFTQHELEQENWNLRNETLNSDYELCRGYCKTCGEPSFPASTATNLFGWKNTFGMRQCRIVLPKFGLAVMGECFLCSHGTEQCRRDVRYWFLKNNIKNKYDIYY